MKKYMCKLGSFLEATIQEIECERETDSSVWIGGRRNAKRSEWSNYFDTWEEAHSSLLEAAERKATSARLALDRANGVMGNIKGMSR